MIRQKIKRIIQEAIKQAQKEEKLSEFEMPKFSVEQPENKEFGDYSANIALILSKLAKKSSLEIAETVKENIVRASEASREQGVSLSTGSGQSFIEKIEIAKPGFINFYLSKEFLQQQVKEILEKKENFGQLENKKQKILVEFISANPTGQLHIGNGRGSFFGDALANVLNKAGYKTEKEYYINDAKNSKQIIELGKTALGKGQSYKTSYLEKKILDLKDRLVEAEQDDETGCLLAQQVQKDIEEFIAKKLKIKFDKYYSEQKELYEKNKITEIFEQLKKKDLTYEKDGAVWLKTTQFGDLQDWVIIREDGQPSYLLADIAYHKDKFERGYDKLINIWGADHQGHVRKMQAVCKMLGYEDKLDILITQIVRIKQGKMSKRRGQIITLESLIDEIGLDAARFFYLQKSLDSQMEFDLELAKEQSQKNPVYYVQYAYARMNSIFKKTEISFSDKKINLLSHPAELNLIKQLIKLPEIIEDTAQDYQIQRLPHYAMELANSFHNFYEQCRVLGNEDKNLDQARLALLKAVQIILKSILDIIGLNAPEKM